MSGQLSYPDRELLSLVADGDEGAFTRLVREIGPPLEVVVRKIVCSEDAVKEILQEALIRIWLSRDKLPQLEKPLPWFKRVVLNETFTWLNKQSRRNKLFTPLTGDYTMFSPGPEGHVSLKETRDILQMAINQLPAQRRKIFQMNRIQGHKPAEIARQLNLSEGYVKNAVSTALNQLRTSLKAAGKIMISVFW